MHSLSTHQIALATRPARVALVPEIGLHLMPEEESFEAFRNHPALLGAPTPYWSKAWPGGQALARFLLDHRDHVAGRTVFDVGGGSGIAAIAAAMAGAHAVTALDLDPNAGLAVVLNAELNGVTVETRCAEMSQLQVAEDCVILAGDLWYEAFQARQVTAWLREAAGRSATVLCGDCRRSYFPRTGLLQLAAYGANDTDAASGAAFGATSGAASGAALQDGQRGREWGVWLLSNLALR